jgi:hypothetical protein
MPRNFSEQSSFQQFRQHLLTKDVTSVAEFQPQKRLTCSRRATEQTHKPVDNLHFRIHGTINDRGVRSWLYYGHLLRGNGKAKTRQNGVNALRVIKGCVAQPDPLDTAILNCGIGYFWITVKSDPTELAVLKLTLPQTGCSHIRSMKIASGKRYSLTRNTHEFVRAKDALHDRTLFARI